MQQRAPGQRRRAWVRQVFQKQQRMHKHVAFGMKLRRLLHSLHRGDLRQHFPEQTTLVEHQERAAGMTFDEHAREFIAHPFPRDRTDLAGQLLDRRKCGRLDRVFKTRRKAQRSQHAQLVFGKTTFRIADGTDDLVFQIPASADKVEHLPTHGIEQHPVDRKIAPRHVFPRILTEAHLIGMAPVRVANIAAKCSDFDRMSVA